MKWTALIIGLCSLTACVNSSSKEKGIQKKDRPQSMIHYQMMYSDLENEVSFPLWFNDSLISANRIIRITRSIYHRLAGDSIQDTAKMVPNEKWIYVFNKQGKVESVYHRTYYDDRLISMFAFRYLPPYIGRMPQSILMDSMVRFKPLETNSTSENFRDDMYKLYKKRSTNRRFTTYYNEENASEWHHIHDKKLTNPLIIDRLIKPSPKDRIVYGELPFPTKIYSVINHVKEEGVRKFDYSQGSISKIQSNNYPFRSVRSFYYGKDGFCSGYVDSLYGNSAFLNKTETNFSLNFMHAPNTVVHTKMPYSGERTFISVENFQYELFP